MNLKPLALAVAAATAGAVGTSVLQSKAAPTPVDLLDPAQTDSAAFQAMRVAAERTCEEVRSVCDALHHVSESADHMHADHGVTAMRVDVGRYVIEHPARSGNPAMTIELRVPQAVAPDAGSQKPTP